MPAAGRYLAVRPAGRQAELALPGRHAEVLRVRRGAVGRAVRPTVTRRPTPTEETRLAGAELPMRLPADQFLPTGPTRT